MKFTILSLLLVGSIGKNLTQLNSIILAQKEPEDFSADEKQAAAAVIAEKRAADVAKA